MDSELTVFIILGVAIAAVCIQLILYSKRQAGLMRRFAASEGYSYQKRDDGTLAKSLDETFGIAEQGCIRAFERVRET